MGKYNYGKGGRKSRGERSIQGSGHRPPVRACIMYVISPRKNGRAEMKSMYRISEVNGKV